jgi:hypothetical protein
MYIIILLFLSRCWTVIMLVLSAARFVALRQMAEVLLPKIKGGKSTIARHQYIALGSSNDASCIYISLSIYTH